LRGKPDSCLTVRHAAQRPGTTSAVRSIAHHAESGPSADTRINPNAPCPTRARRISVKSSGNQQSTFYRGVGTLTTRPPTCDKGPYAGTAIAACEGHHPPAPASAAFWRPASVEPWFMCGNGVPNELIHPSACLDPWHAASRPGHPGKKAGTRGGIVRAVPLPGESPVRNRTHAMRCTRLE
jgi:hypothetical protein